jgi:methylaspartate mutase sigma subunit
MSVPAVRGPALGEPALAARVREAGLRVALAVPGDDVHVVANQLAESVLKALGYEVVNLGVLVPVAELVETAAAERPDAILLSSLNGHALANCGELPARLRDAEIDVPVFLGGNLSVGQERWAVTERRFAALGFARTFSPEVDLLSGLGTISAALLSRAAAPRELGHAG